MANDSYQTAFWNVRDLEKKDFQEFYEEDIYAPPENNNFYFAPSWHFNSGLLTQDIVQDIRDNARQVLSVGSGLAYLERFLVKRLGVKAEQISLSDKEVLMPEGFEKFVFDMYGEWPEFNKRFDYVIFPESVLLNCRFRCAQERRDGLYHLIESCLAVMTSPGQIRINGHCQSEEDLDVVGRLLNKNYSDSTLDYSRRLVVVQKKR